MISNNRAHYSSGDEFLSALKQDESWLSQLKQLQNSTDDARTLRDKANEKIGKGYAYHFWDIYNHQVELVVRELWDIDELSMPKLKIQTIGMLSMEWLEQHTELITPLESSDSSNNSKSGEEKQHDPPANCLETVRKYLKPQFTIPNGSVLNSQAQLQKAVKEVDTASHAQIGILMTVCKEVGVVKGNPGNTGFVRILIGLGFIHYVDDNQIRRIAHGFSDKINKLPSRHAQWSGNDRTLGDKIYNALIRG